MKPLTPAQQQFCEQNHGLLLDYMEKYLISPEHYGRLSLRYMRTAVRYQKEPELRQYRFSTILWRNLGSEWSNIRREWMSMPKETALCEDRIAHDDSDAPLDSVLMEELERVLTRKQLESIFLRNQGYTNREIGELSGVCERAIEKRFSRIRKAIRSRIILECEMDNGKESARNGC